MTHQYLFNGCIYGRSQIVDIDAQEEKITEINVPETTEKTKDDIGYIFTYKGNKYIVVEADKDSMLPKCEECAFRKDKLNICFKAQTEVVSCFASERKDGKSVYFKDYIEHERITALKQKVEQLTKERDEMKKLFEGENNKLLQMNRIQYGMITGEQRKNEMINNINKRLENDKANLKDTIKLLDERTANLNNKLSSIRIITNGLKNWGNLEVKVVCKTILAVLDER